jgi:hypothetical protein
MNKEHEVFLFQERFWEETQLLVCLIPERVELWLLKLKRWYGVSINII